MSPLCNAHFLRIGPVVMEEIREEKKNCTLRRGYFEYNNKSLSFDKRLYSLSLLRI